MYMDHVSKYWQLIGTLGHTLEQYGPHSSLHGFYHIFQASTAEKRWFWLIILLAAISALTAHTAMSVNRYIRNISFVHVTLDQSTKAHFPGVTLCRLKPFSESLLVQYPEVVAKYFKDNWGYFDRWYVKKRERKPGETRIVYRNRIRKLLARFLDLVWASDNVIDLSMDAQMSILHCSFADRPCSYKDFKRIRDPDGWYCYSFVTKESLPVKTIELSLILLTDTTFYHPIFDGSHIRYENVSKLDFTKPTESDSSDSLRYFQYYLNSSGRSINEVSPDSKLRPNGYRAIVHEPDSHPMTSLHRLKFESGLSTMVEVRQTSVHRLKQPNQFDCKHPPVPKVQYATEFHADRGYTNYAAFDKLQDDYVIAKKQEFMFKACGCYSHRYPISVGVEQLCYYVPKGHRRQPTSSQMARMDCHDKNVDFADHDLTQNLLNQLNDTVLCNSRMLEFSSNAISWPSESDIVGVVNKYLLPQLVNGTGFIPGKDASASSYSIFNFSNADIAAVMAGKRIVSRQEAVIDRLFGQKCFNFSHDKWPPPIQDAWCLNDVERLRKNLLHVSIKYLPQQAILAKEHYSFKWPEVLSEFGGKCGLWLGISVITVLEILQAFIRPFVF